METTNVRIGGAVVYWRLTASSRSALAQNTLLKEALPEVSKLAALRGALREHLDDDQLIRPTASEGTLAIVREKCNGGNRENAKNEYEQLRTAWVTGNEVRVSPEPEWLAEAQDKYTSNLGVVSPSTVGSALAEISEEHFDALCLRETGGVYWIPRYCLDQWSELAKHIEASALPIKDAKKKTSRIYRLNADYDEDMVRSIGDALTDDITSTCDRMLEEVQSGELAERACETRIRRLADLQSRVGRYETLFAKPLDSLRASLEKVGGAAALAALAASASKMRQPATA